MDRRSIFETDGDRHFFLAQMREAFSAADVGLFADCLMVNHFHFLLATAGTPLHIPMHRLLLRHSLRFNRLYGRVGHLFQARYTAIPCRDLGHLIQLVSYIHRNPVRAGLVSSPAEWPWSSHEEFLKGSGPYLDLGRLEACTGMSYSELRASYLERLASPEALPTGVHSVEEAIREAARESGVDPIRLAGGARGEPFSRAKRALISRAPEIGYSLAELARGLHCSRAALTLLKKRDGNPSA